MGMGTGIARLRPGGAVGHRANQREQAGVNLYAKVKVAGFSRLQLACRGCIVLFVIV